MNNEEGQTFGSRAIVLRFTLSVGVAWFGFYFISWLGTQRWDFSVAGVFMDFVGGSLVLLPAASLPWLGCRWRHALVGAGVTLLLAFVPGELFARVQEYQVLRTFGKHPDEDLFIARWAPYEHHTIAYYTNSGWTGWD